MKKHWLFALALALPLAACNNGAYSPPSPAPGPVPPGPASVPLVSFMNTLFASTSETASPVEINTLPIDTSDESPGLYAGLII